jgi:hypothetical protein
LTVGRDHPGAAGARHNLAAHPRLALFDGRDYKVSCGAPPSDASFSGWGVLAEDVSVLGIERSDPEALTRRYQEKAALVYAGEVTFGRLSRNRAALMAADRPRAAEDGDRQGRR